MSNYTPELNLVVAEDDDDTADYLTLTDGLAGSLNILDGLFNQATGHSHGGAHQGGVLGPNAFLDNTIPGAKLVDHSVYPVKIAINTLSIDQLVTDILEKIFTGSVYVASTHYTVPLNSPIMWVWCPSPIQVTLPTGANRPITVRAYGGDCNVNATSGVVVGGSPDLVTGTVTNGHITNGDAITFKCDGTNWAAV